MNLPDVELDSSFLQIPVQKSWEQEVYDMYMKEREFESKLKSVLVEEKKYKIEKTALKAPNSFFQSTRDIRQTILNTPPPAVNITNNIEATPDQAMTLVSGNHFFT